MGRGRIAVIKISMKFDYINIMLFQSSFILKIFVRRSQIFHLRMHLTFQSRQVCSITNDRIRPNTTEIKYFLEFDDGFRLCDNTRQILFDGAFLNFFITSIIYSILSLPRCL